MIHDERLERTTNGHGLLQDADLAELRKLDAGAGQQIPMLQEVADLLPATMAMNLELKGPGTAAPVAAWLAGAQPPQPVLVSSFDHAELRQFRALNQQIPVAPLFAKAHPDMLAIGQELNLSLIHI